MKQLTKKERNNIYKRGLNYLPFNKYSFICTNLLCNKIYLFEIPLLLKELYLFKPKNVTHIFQPYIEYPKELIYESKEYNKTIKEIQSIRATILMFCIEMTKTKK